MERASSFAKYREMFEVPQYVPFLRQDLYNSLLGDFSCALPRSSCLLCGESLISEDFLDILPLAGMPALLGQYDQPPTHDTAANESVTIIAEPCLDSQRERGKYKTGKLRESATIMPW